MKNKLSLVLLMIVFIVALASSAEAKYLVDWENKENIPSDKKWHIKFNDSVNSESITSNIYVKDYNGNLIETESSLLHDDTVIVEPVNKYSPGAYHLYINDDVTSINGQHLNQPTRMMFSVVTQDTDFAGTGKQSTNFIHLKSGLAAVSSTYNGSGNFIVWLMDSKGDKIELAANEIGSYAGKTIFGIDEGNYFFDVTADGSWSISVNQPEPTREVNPPVKIEGTGDSFSEFIYFDGLTTFDMNYSGDRNFIIWLLDKNGNHVDLLANEIGSGNVNKTLGIDAGIYVLQISASGDWVVNIEQ